MKRYLLAFGEHHLECIVASGQLLGVLESRPAPALPSLPDALAHTLNHPMGRPPLADWVAHGERITIVVSDITRYSAAHHFLPPLLAHLNRAGIADRQLHLLFALGIHRRHSRAEQVAILGEEVATRVHFVDHEAQDHAQQVQVGTTSRGTPVALNRLVVEADRVILTGAIGFHYFAGFTGGRKSLLPGVASFQTCMANHHLVLHPQEGMGKHPHARTGVLEGNAVHEDMAEALGMIRPAFLLNTLLNPSREVTALVAGDPIQAHLQGCGIFLEQHAITIPQAADLVLASCGGFPADINFIQAHKTLDNAAAAVRPGGVIILLAECRDGMGHPTFHGWFRHGGVKQVEQELRAHYEIYGQTALSVLLKAQQATIILVSRLNEKEVREMSLVPASSPVAAMRLAEEILGRDYRYYVIPNGSHLLPRVTSS